MLGPKPWTFRRVNQISGVLQASRYSAYYRLGYVRRLRDCFSLRQPLYDCLQTPLSFGPDTLALHGNTFELLAHYSTMNAGLSSFIYLFFWNQKLGIYIKPQVDDDCNQFSAVSIWNLPNIYHMARFVIRDPWVWRTPCILSYWLKLIK